MTDIKSGFRGDRPDGEYARSSGASGQEDGSQQFDVSSAFGRAVTLEYAGALRTPGPFVGRGPRAYRRSDGRILEDVCDRLTEHGQLDASDIEVKVEHGEVVLTGTVDSKPAKRIAEDAAECVSGVTQVQNQLRVGTSVEPKQSPRS